MSEDTQNNKPSWPLWYQRSVQPFVQESALWPVLFALWGHIVVALGAMLLHLIRDGTILLSITAFWFLVLSYKAVQFERQHLGRMAGLSFTVFSSWLASVLLALFVNHFGLY
jgi:hypothetical protein